MTDEIYRVAENEPGHGSFHMTVVEGDDRREYEVPAVYFDSPKLQREYIKKAQADKPVIAFRAGRRGVCHVEINPYLLVNPILTRYFYERWADNLTVRNENPGEPNFIDPINRQPPERIDVTAQTLAGLSFSATILFAPSPK